MPDRIYKNGGAQGNKPWTAGALTTTEEETGAAWQEYRRALGSDYRHSAQSTMNEDLISQVQAQYSAHVPPPPAANDPINEAITRQEVANAIARAKGGKSPGPDGLTNRLLKVGKDPVIDLYHQLFNVIWTQGGCTPQEWARVLIKPVYKNKDDTHNPEYYRGIALASTTAKIFESVLDNRLAKYVAEHDTCTTMQYGGQSDHSVKDALYPLLHHIEHQKANGRIVWTAMIDFQTAFPSLWRERLYLTLSEQGIHGPMYHALKNLTRHHEVRVLHPQVPEDQYATIQRGLTEGSVLSPRLYAIFLANLLRALRTRFPLQHCFDNPALPYVGTLAYVDDICLCADTPQALQEMLTFVQVWAENNKATINYKKSEVIVFNETRAQKVARGKTQWHAVGHFPHRHTHPLAEVNTFKYLGVQLDSDLTMNAHCNLVIKKIKIATSRVLRYQQAMNCGSGAENQPHILLTLYKSLVQVHSTMNLIYLKTERQIERVQTALDESLAACMGVEQAPPSVLQLECGILPAQLQQYIELACLHAHLTTASRRTRPAVALFEHQLTMPATPDTIHARMSTAMTTLQQGHTWGHPPPLTPAQRHLSRAGRLTKKNQLQVYRRRLQVIASTLWRDTVLQGQPLAPQPPQSPLQHYLQLTTTDLHRTNLANPAHYLTNKSALPFYPLLRLRTQTSSALRSQKPEDTVIPYAARGCLRCHPMANQSSLVYHTHFPIDNVEHIVTSCHQTHLPRQELERSLNALCTDLGIKPWATLPATDRAALSLGVAPPKAWKWRRDVQDTWIARAIPISAMFALGIQDAL